MWTLAFLAAHFRPPLRSEGMRLGRGECVRIQLLKAKPPNFVRTSCIKIECLKRRKFMCFKKLIKIATPLSHVYHCCPFLAQYNFEAEICCLILRRATRFASGKLQSGYAIQ